MRTLLQGTTKSVAIGGDGPFVIIGERINPSGRKRLVATLTSGDMSLVRNEALAQVQAGAEVVDINVSAAEVDEETTLPLAVQAVADIVDAPICIDTANAQALAAALAVCPGRPLVNSATGEEASLEAVLPLVGEYNCAVIGLCMDGIGIPTNAQRRLGIAERILDCAQSHGISEEDVIIDPLAMAVATDNMAARVTLEAIKLIRMNLGVSTTLGSSNISFGLPERSLVNRVFLAMAMAAGLSSAIVDPVDIEIRKTIAACDLLLSRDEFAQRLLQRFRTGW